MELSRLRCMFINAKITIMFMTVTTIAIWYSIVSLRDIYRSPFISHSSTFSPYSLFLFIRSFNQYLNVRFRTRENERSQRRKIKAEPFGFPGLTIVTVENGKQFRILPNKRAFNKSAYQTPRSIKHSIIKRTITHLLTSKASMFLNCQILFLFNYVMLMFLERWYKKSLGN